MKRRAVNLLCLLSLLVFAASATIWVRSYFVWDEFRQERHDAAWNSWSNSILWTRGNLFIVRVSGDGREAPSGPAVSSQWKYNSKKPGPYFWWTRNEAHLLVEFGGVQFAQVRPVAAGTPFWIQQLTLPLWLFLPTAIPPWLWWRRRRQRWGRGFAVE